MSGTLALAASIAAMDRSELRSLVASRRILSPGSVQDPLGLALELLRPESVTRALQTLDRAMIAGLAALGRDEESVDPAVADQLRTLALVGVDADRVVALPEVDELLAAALRERDGGGATGAADVAGVSGISPDSGTGSPSGQSSPGAAAADTSGWYASALTSVRRVAALLMVIEERPAVLGRRGTATAIAVRELAAAIRSEPETTAELLAVVQAAGLVAPVTVPNRRGGDQLLLVPSAAADAWLALPLTARWIRLGRAAIHGMGPALRGSLQLSDGDVARAVRTVLPREYPLLPETARAEAEDFARLAEELGLTVGGRLSAPAERLLGGDPEAALLAAEQDFPPLASGVYLQPDLSLIVPGPLTAEDELALAEIADAEQWGVAITLRLSPTSLRRALRDGYRSAQIRELLERLSLTGIPQPLDYLLGDLERTHPPAQGGRRRAPAAGRGDATGGGVDDAGAAGSSSTAGSDGAADPTDSDGAADAGSSPAPSGHPSEVVLDELVERVHASAGAAPGTGELSRRLELAIRDRSPVRVTASAGGEQRSFTLLPVAITGGRLRATDELAGVQRTLPLSAITAVEAG